MVQLPSYFIPAPVAKGRTQKDRGLMMPRSSRQYHMHTGEKIIDLPITITHPKSMQQPWTAAFVSFNPRGDPLPFAVRIHTLDR